MEYPHAARLVGALAETMSENAGAMSQDSKTEAAPRLLYLVSEDWYFLSHRLPMARAAREAGFDVHVATRVAKGGAAIEAEGFTLHALNWRRGSTNPLDFAQAVTEVRGAFRQIAPDLVHQVAFWPSVVGAIAASGLGLPRLSALAGMGFAFTSNAPKARMVRGLLRPLLRPLLSGPSATVLVQNPDDYQAMIALGIAPERIALIPGSGVDTERLTPLPEPAGPITMAYVGRLLDDKGLRALVEAQALLAERGESIRLLIAGETDTANPASIPAAEIEKWRRQRGVELLGHVADIGTVWAKAHIAVLPSRREGLPKSLLEAAAFGRAIVATDVTGCREIAREGINALLVPVDDARALADAVQRLAHDADLRAKFAAAGRGLVEREFASSRVGPETVNLYRAMLSSRD
jgi:glycosyltransferase involved in cell wall biosynthesis